ncbi:MAG: response regulator [Roseburia sp.]|nr:response regulator [Anaeroplasma bactoclasticum]MCM1196251.1 response regulator [Roseburia sp.]MCM1556854.1 response regulator [Anaeroplasma bactoclasticum]
MKQFIYIKKIIALSIVFLFFLIFGFMSSNSVFAEAEQNESQYHFVFICPNKAHEYWTPIIEGIKKADDKQGTITEILGPDSYDNWEESLLKNMEEVLKRKNKPDGILVRGGVSGLANLINQAVDMGIPVITIDTDEALSKRTAFIGSDYTEIGKKSAQAIVLKLVESEIGMVMASEDPSDTGFKIRSIFENMISDYGIKIVDTAFLVTNKLQDSTQNAIKQEEDTISAIKEMLLKNKNIKALFTTGAVNAVYAAKAKLELGLDDLLIVGQDDIEETLKFIKDGTIYAVTAQRTDLMGYLSIVNFKKFKDTASLSKTIYDTGITLVTKQNVDTYKNFDSIIDTKSTTIRVGYYNDNDPAFQDGFSSDERKSGYAYDYYQMLASFAGWKYEYIYGSKQEIRQKLLDGDVDIMAGAYKSTYESGLDFSSLDMGLSDSRYFAVKKGNSKLLDELNYAMAQIDTFFPVFTLELYQKYYDKTSFLTLTDREEQWLIGKNSLTFGYVKNLLPFSDEDQEKNPIGLAKELIRFLEEFTGIEIVPIAYETVFDIEQALKENRIDIGYPTRYDLWAAESKGLKQTNSIVTDRMMIIYHGAYTSSTLSKLAVSKTSLGMKEYLEYNYPNSSITEYDSFNEMISAVQKGSGECIIGYSSILQRVLSGYDDTEGLNISYLNTSLDICLSVNQDDGILTIILNKMLNQINKEVITGTLLQYAGIQKNEQEITFADYFKQYGYIFAIVLVAFFIILALTFAFYIKKSRQHSQEQLAMQASLEKAVEIADSANKAKTNFLSSMSHDIRTPMNAIIGMTDIAKKYTDDKEKLKDCLDKVSLSGQHLLTLINDILDISKIESGKFVLSPINFSLRKLVDNLVNIIRPMMKAKNQSFDVRIHHVEHEMLYGDELRISQIFINILSNAVKYTPNEGKIVLELCEELIDTHTVRLTYTVQDNGIGMSKEYMERMYDAFTRADDSRTNKIQGTGLGLAIVKQMVLLMNGTIDCESEMDKGTTFVVKLLLPIGQQDKFYTLPAVDILLIDDDEVFLTITEETIKDMGAKVESASCAKRALELVQKRHALNQDYAVILVDLKMPEKNGIEIVQSIRNIVKENTYIFLVSAYDWSDIEQDAKNSGANGFISKPLFKSYLSEKIGHILNTEETKEETSLAMNEDLKGLKVLIAEDNELNWEVISELLAMCGISSDHAENGKMTVEMMENSLDNTYDLIFMDIQMPIMNGKDATIVLRKSARDYVKNIPIIAMTADAFAEDIASCLAVGMDEHISKPVDIDKTCWAIKHVLDKRKQK